MFGEKWNRQGREALARNNFGWDSLEMFGVQARHPVVRAVDFHSRDSAESDIIQNLQSSLRHLQTRKERHGEFLGRFKSGMWRKPQHVLDVRDPTQIPADALTEDPAHNWALIFTNDIRGWWGRDHEPTTFLLVDAPSSITYEHKEGRTRTEIPGDSGGENRKVLAVCVKETKLSSDAVDVLEKVAEAAGVPFFRIDTLFAANRLRKAS